MNRSEARASDVVFLQLGVPERQRERTEVDVSRPMDVHDVVEASLAAEPVVADGGNRVVHLGSEPLDTFLDRHAEDTRHVPLSRKLDLDADGAVLLDLARLHQRGQREAAHVAHGIPGRTARDGRLGHDDVQRLGGPLGSGSGARPHEAHAHRADDEISGAEGKERPAPHELHDPRSPRHGSVAGEKRVLVFSQERTLEEIGHLGVVDVFGVDLDVRCSRCVDVLVDAEGDLLAHDSGGLVDRRV